MKYVKPDVYVERFKANAYCQNCGYTEYDKAIDITCIINGTENIYSDNTKPGSTACTYTVYKTYTVATGGYVSDIRNTIETVGNGGDITFETNHNTSTGGSGFPSWGNQGNQGNHDNCTYIAAGTYLVWSSGGLTHMGLITPELESVLTQSS